MVSPATHTIGVDGGGSRCRIAIARTDGTVIGSAEGGAANPTSSLQGTIAILRDILDRARRQAGLDQRAINAACAHFGLAGVIGTQTARAVADAFPIAQLTVTDDRPTNMAGALGDSDGCVAAIGTGSFLGRQSGDTARFVGGWGLELGDQASGAWLGQQLLSRILMAEDAMTPASDLMRATLAEFGTPAAIVIFARDAKPTNYAAFAPRIIAAAEDNDPAAIVLLQDAATYIRDAAFVLGFSPGDRFCLLGGLGPHYAPYLDRALMQNRVEPKGTALDGALILAARRTRAPA